MHDDGVVAVLVATVIVAASLATGVALTPASGAGAQQGLAQEQIDADGVLMSASLAPDGHAEWVIEYRIRLATDEEVAAFEDLQTDVRENASLYTSRFAGWMNDTVAAASNATGREMRVENVTVSAEQRALPQEYGVVTYRFRWTGFATVTDREVRAGDALAGFFLDQQTTLEVAWPEGYERQAVAPSPDDAGDRSVRWHGAREFGPDEPSVVVAPAGSGSTVVGSGLLAAGGVLAAIILAALFVATRRRGALGAIPGLGLGGTRDAGADGAARSQTAGASDTDDEPPSDLLSNEEQVLQLLDGEGGRLKQQQIAARLDWTAAKTSQVIGDMREEDAVETFRLGRENVVTLPDEGLGDDLGPDSST